MSTDIPIAEHVNSPSRFRRWRTVNGGVLLISLLLPWVTISCDSHASKAGYEVLTQYYVVFDYPLALLTLALPAFALANVLMALRVGFQRRIWLMVPVMLAAGSVAVGGLDLSTLLSMPGSHFADSDLAKVIYLAMALPIYVAAYTLTSPRIPPRRRVWLWAPFVLIVGGIVATNYRLATYSTSPMAARDLIPILVWCALFIAANFLMALQVPLQRRSWLLVPLALCVCGAVLGPWAGYSLNYSLELQFGAYVFLLGLLSAVVLELYDAKAAWLESSESQLGTAARMFVE